MVNQRFCLTVLIVIVFCILFSIIAFAKKEDDSTSVKMTTCRLASQILGNNQRVCVFVVANNTQYIEYVQYDECPCPRK